MRKGIVIAILLTLYQCYANAQNVYSHAVSDDGNYACRKDGKITSEKLLNTKYLAAKKSNGCLRCIFDGF